MKSYLYILIGIIVGVISTLLVSKCNPQPSIDPPSVRVDTIYIKPDKIPEPVVRYVSRTKIDTFVKYVTWIEWRTEIDSIFQDTSIAEIPVNRYTDVIDQDSVKLEYSIETLGFLTGFDAKLTSRTQSVVIVKPEKRWVAGLGLSDKANWKGSVGYKGWMTEIEFSKGYKFNQLYITKQWSF